MLIDGLMEMTRLMSRRVRQIRGEPVVVCEVSVIAKDVRAAGPVGGEEVLAYYRSKPEVSRAPALTLDRQREIPDLH
jgi:hypothetical protein